MTCRRPRLVRTVLTGVTLGLLLAAAPAANAQLSFPSLTNSSNPDEAVPGTASTASRERESFVDVISS